MDQAVKQKWLQALRGGQYQQAREALRVGEGFCCLGVLCDLYLKDGQPGEWQEGGIIETPAVDRRWSTPTEERVAMLPEAVVLWAGLHHHEQSTDPRVTDRGYTTTLSSLNDNGRSFTQIAKIIEEQL